MSDAHSAGESGQLDVRITRKAFQAASGEHIEVLRDVAFGLRPSELGAIVGPSGAGKTTMLRIVAGLDADFDGEVKRPSGRVGMVFQEPRLLPWRTVEDNVRLIAPEIAGTARDALFDTLELSAHRAHFPGELSLGLARRVALARALAIEPALLLLDEPFVSLDAALAARLREQLAALVETRTVTTLLVTHDIEEAVRLADRVLLLSPRPARIVAEVALPTPRRARFNADIAAMMADVANRLQPS